MSASFARTICGWTGKLPEDCRPDADAILLGAAQGGADLAGLAGLAGEIYARSRPGKPDEDEGQAFEDRSVRLETTFGGAGVLHGDLSPECASVLSTVLDALSAPAGAEDALDNLVRLCVELDRLHHHPGTGGTGQDGTDADGGQSAASTDTARAWEALERAIIGKTVDLLSGPGGLASFLRRRQLGARLGGPSLPLDIGYSETIPAGIRNAVTLRDTRCRWAGGCSQPASACEVHHVRHKKNGGKTSTRECVLLCFFHHQVVIHRWGWTLVLNPDGTTTAWNKDRTKVLHSHSPPADTG